MKKISVLLLVNENKDPKYEFTNEIVRFLNYKKCSVYVEEKHISHIEGAFPFNKNEDKINFGVILGGDGTVLNYAHKYRDLNLPFYGINLGRVGCLTEARRDKYTIMLDEILRGNYFIEERNSIKCEIESSHGNQTLVAFNEISINRAKIYKMLLLQMLINEKNATHFYADGVIVATATGSSAYNLSSGGPLLLPSAKNFVITPLCPQLRTITSLVVNDTDKITLSFEVNNVNSNSDKENPVLVADGMKQIELYENDKITVTKDSAKLRIIKVDSDVSLFEPMYKVTYSTNNLFGKK